MRASLQLGERDRPDESIAAAQYIAAMTRELSRLARRQRLDALSYLLDIAQMEAEANARASSDPE